MKKCSKCSMNMPLRYFPKRVTSLDGRGKRCVLCWCEDHDVYMSDSDKFKSRSDHQRACFNFFNIQPLIWEDNNSKSDKVPTNFDIEEYVSVFQPSEVTTT